MQLIPRNEKKRWLIYKFCLFILILFGLILAALFAVLILYPHDHHAQNLFLFPFIVSCPITLIAISVMRKLHLTKHYAAESYSLPYKLRKDKTLLLIFIGCAIAMSALLVRKPTSTFAPPLLVVSTNTSTLFSVPAWMLVPITVCSVIMLIYFLISWQGTILYHDHLHWYGFGSKKDISYNEIKRIEIKRWGDYEGYYSYLQLFGGQKSPLAINLTPYTNSSIIITLNIIHQYAPDATFDELAEMMRQGEFPIMWASNKNPFNQDSSR